jgi:hypothetical protein
MVGVARLVVSLLALSALSCRFSRAPIDVAVVFENSWTLGADTLAASEQAIVKDTALETLRRAYAGFNVRFAEASAGDRVIRVEDTPYGSVMQFRAPGAAGLTYPASTVSSVRVDVLFFAELSAAGCRTMDRCTKTRSDLLEGLGRGRRDRRARVGTPGRRPIRQRCAVRRLLRWQSVNVLRAFFRHEALVS